MKQIGNIGINKKGFDKLISTRFYNQITIPQLEYGLAISTFNLRNIRELENCQNQCLRQIFSGRPYTSTKVMFHTTNLPSIKNRIAILQAKFICRSLSLPNDSTNENAPVSPIHPCQI
jgi:hypothetical protein